MTSNEANNYYCFAVKNWSELKSLVWLKGKKEAIINNNNSFQNALDEVLDYQTIEKDPQRISKLKSCIKIQYNWQGINFPAGPKEWIKFQRNNKTITFNILFIPHNTKTTSVAYRSKYNNKRKKQVILLMITDGKKYHYLVVTKLSPLLEGKSSNHHGYFYCLSCTILQFIHCRK